MRWRRERAGAMRAIAKAAGAGAVLVGFATGVNSLHYASPILDTAAISRDPVLTDRCTDSPADPTCPPTSPNDVKCTTAAWHGSALCAGGPFDPNVLSTPACSPVFVGCPGGVPNTPQPPVPAIVPPSKSHEPPSPATSPPAVTDQPVLSQPPPLANHPEPGTPPAPPPSVVTPPAPVAPAPSVEAPPAPVAPPPATAPAPAPAPSH
jgi:hypothetical protein